MKKIISRADIKDIAQVLGISAIIMIPILIVGLFLDASPGEIDIYVRDSSGNYVLDNEGRAKTKRQECYENRKLGVALGYGEKNGTCTLEGNWVPSKEN